MTLKQFSEITEWQRKTFPKATVLTTVSHLEEEMEELKLALDSDDTGLSVREEFADCFILLFGAAATYGLTYDSIVELIDKKMEINYARKWGEPKENGVVNHIKEESK